MTTYISSSLSKQSVQTTIAVDSQVNESDDNKTDNNLSNTVSEDIIVAAAVVENKSDDNKTDNNLTDTTVHQDIISASEQLLILFGKNNYAMASIELIGNKLALYKNEENRNDIWVSKELKSVMNARSFVSKSVVKNNNRNNSQQQNNIRHFYVYGYIVHTYFNDKECDTETCASLQNIKRDREVEKGISSNIDIMDSIHVAILHGYNTGQRLYSGERKIWHNMEVKIDDECTDLETGLMRKMLDNRFNINAERNIKFVTKMDDKDVTTKKEFGSFSLYRFGYKFYYHSKYENKKDIDRYYNGGQDSYQDWYITPKYKDVKEEVCNEITIIAYVNENTSAEQFLTTDYGKSLKPTCKQQCEDYGINSDISLPLSHLLCLLIYCNLGRFCTIFSATFRIIKEKISSMKQRNASYGNYSRILVQCVHCYGTVLAKSDITHFYHGIDRIMHFPSTHGQFCSPTSTTTEYTVAVNFAKEGIVLELANNRSDRMSFFDVEIISCYSNEAEKLFFQGGFFTNQSESAYTAMPFKSIRNILDKKNYEHIITAISCFQQMIKGKNAENNTLELKAIHVKFLRRLIEKKKILPNMSADDSQYISMLFNSLLDAKKVSIFTNYMNIHDYHAHYYFNKFREIFCDVYSEDEQLQEGCEKRWGRRWKTQMKDGHKKGFYPIIYSFKFDLLFKLFPELIIIEIYHLPLTNILMKEILNLGIWNDESRKSMVRILLKEADTYYKKQRDFGEECCVNKYANDFKSAGLSIKIIGTDEEENKDECEDEYEDEEDVIEIRAL